MAVTGLKQAQLKQNILDVLKKQGYRVRDGVLELRHDDRKTKRDAHILAKAERILVQENFVLKNIPLISKHLPDGKDIDIAKIKPRLIEVEAGTNWETIFRWWSLVWWSLPHERAYGRQMRFLVWDDHHKAAIGLIGLQSPLLSWSVRDSHLGIAVENRDYWVNQSLSAQRLGALPPYNQILGGKLVASLLTSNSIRSAFERKYKNVRTIMRDRKLPAKLLFITTTGAYGKSSVYSRLRFHGKSIVEFIGLSSGVGSFHIPNSLYQDLMRYLESKNLDTTRGYGSGPSRKMRLIEQAMGLLGFEQGTRHSIQRAVYLFPLADNVKAVISENKKPHWVNRSVADLTSYWKERWGVPRSERDKSYLSFTRDQFIQATRTELAGFKKTYQKIKHG